MTDLSTLSDADLEREIERLCQEQKRREVQHLRAMSKMQPLFLPSRLYTSVG